MSRYSNYGQLDSPIAEEADTFFLTMNNRLRPDQLQPGQVAMSINGRMDVDGSWQPRKGISSFGPLLTSSSAALVLPFYVYASKTISSATRATTTVTVTTSTDHGFTDQTQVGISDVTGVVDPTGNRLITVTGLDTFTFEIPGAAGSETYTLGGSAAAGSPYITDSINGAFGSCRFSDPRNSDSDYVLIATNNEVKAINLSTAAVTSITYPAGDELTVPCEMVQVFDKVYLFREGVTTLVWNGVLTGSPAFAKVANGNYTQPLVLTTANNAACTAGVVTITNTHNLAVGDTVTIMDEGSTGLVRFDKYQVATVTGTTSFTFYASVDNFTATSVVLGVRQSNGRGFTHMPAPAWGIPHQRRLIVPFAYTTTGTSGSEVITARNVSDEILFSDILDADTYDLLQDNFRVTAGIADYLQTVHPFADDAAGAFDRNSLHLITGLSGDLTDLAIREIAREMGLVARKSVVTLGNSVFFLSDNGVYSAEFGDLYNLRGAQKPLSDEIDPIIKRINSAYAYRAVGIVHDNRYYLAVPLDGSTVNNYILVYNVLNKGWESLDKVSQLGWDVANFILGSPTGVNKLYAVNSYGGLHIMEDRVDDSDVIRTYPGVDSTTFALESSVTTRAVTFGTTGRKAFKSYELHVESSESNESNATIAATSENLDEDISLSTIYDLNDGANLAVGEDASLRGRIGGIRSYGLQLIFTPTQGRPKLRMTRISGQESFRANTKAV